MGNEEEEEEEIYQARRHRTEEEEFAEFMERAKRQFYQEREPQQKLKTFKLEQYNIKPFSGDYTDWRRFQNQFQVAIEQQPMAPSTKLGYLQGYVTGEAKETILHLTIQDSNYEIALKLLEQKYDDPKIIERTLFERLLNIKRASTESHLR